MSGGGFGLKFTQGPSCALAKAVGGQEGPKILQTPVRPEPVGLAEGAKRQRPFFPSAAGTEEQWLTYGRLAARQT